MATALLFPMIFASSLRARRPHNYIILILFTICKSTVLAFISVQNRADLGLISILTNGTIFLGLVLLNCQYKRQSTVLFEISFVFLLCFATFGSLLFFFEGPAGSLIFCGVWVLIFSLVSVRNSIQVECWISDCYLGDSQWELLRLLFFLQIPLAK